jgi:hypothetical protein
VQLNDFLSRDGPGRNEWLRLGRPNVLTDLHRSKQLQFQHGQFRLHAGARSELNPGKSVNMKYDRKSLECCALWISLGPWESKKTSKIKAAEVGQESQRLELSNFEA